MSTTNNNREDNMTNTQTTRIPAHRARALLTMTENMVATQLEQKLSRPTPGEYPIDHEVTALSDFDLNPGVKAEASTAYAEITLPSLAIIMTGCDQRVELTWGQDRDYAEGTAEEALIAARLLTDAAETQRIAEDYLNGELGRIIAEQN